MAIVAELDSVSHAVGGKDLFDNISVSISSGDRVGLIGHNGSGKSTLLSLLAKVTSPDAGELRFRRGLRVSAVEQFLPQALAHVSAVDAVDAERWQAEAVLSKLGFSQASLNFRVGDLSGGQQNRLMFARAVVDSPDLLLLDEPTNHLDLATIVIFEDYLKNLASTFILVSHDRAFLDAVTNRSLFLRDRRLSHFKGAYSTAKFDLDHMDDAAEAALANEEKKIDALKVSAKRLAVWQSIHGSEKLARRAKNMQRRIDRLQENKTTVTRGSPLDLSVELGTARSKEVIRISNADVTVQTHSLFRVDELLIRPGERIALLGHNGVGKSTFIRKLVAACTQQSISHSRDQNADSSTTSLATQDTGYNVSPQTRLGYYDQELAQVHGTESIAEFVRNRVGGSSTIVRNRLIAAGFPYIDHDKRVDVLSGGERARLLFIVLSLQKPNFLILDEPTNHIDIEGKEQLENELVESDAAVLITSHDRYFIDSVAERFLLIDAGKLVEVNEPDTFFRSSPMQDEPTQRIQQTASSSSNDVLERIIELEDKLEADRARKPKFQKPKLHDVWQSELQDLYRQIEGNLE